MNRLTLRILEVAESQAEGTTLSAKALLHLGKRAAVDQALSRLVRRGVLLRLARGVYTKPTEGRFGVRPPTPEKVINAMAEQRSEVIVPSGAAAANALGFTTQVPVRTVYLTSGPSRRLKLGAQIVELRHAPRWQLTLPGRPGEALRALAWLGRHNVKAAASELSKTLLPSELRAISSVRTLLPTWLAETVSAIAPNV